MSVLLKTERALRAWMLGNAAYLIASDGTYVVEENGLRIRLQSGFGFFLPVVTGQSDVEMTGPAVVCSCPSGRQVENSTLTHLVDVQVELNFPADEGQNQRYLLDAFNYAVSQLQAALYRTDFTTVLTDAESGFACLHAPGSWTQESGFTDRLRTYRFRRQLVVAPSDFT